MPECRKCCYFMVDKDQYCRGVVLMGFCRLRQKYVTDISIMKEHCKDRATIPHSQDPAASGAPCAAI